MSVVRKATGAAALVTACAVLAGCTGGSASPAPAPTTSTGASDPATPSATADPVTLRLAVYGDEAAVATYQEMADAYSASNPGVTVTLESDPDAATSANRVSDALAAGTGPDLFLLDQAHLPGFVDDELLQPVDLLLGERDIRFGDDYQRVGLEAFSAEGGLQCMPNDVSPLVVYYNRKLLKPRRLVEPGEDVPTPETGWKWDQFAEAARLMSRGAVAGVHIDPSLTELTPWVRSGGSDVVDDPSDPTTLTLADEDNREALEQILLLARDPSVSLTRAQVAAESPLDRFRDGRLGMMIGSRALVPELRANPRLRFDVYPLPSFGGFRTVALIDGLCLAADTEHTEAAADFLAWAVTTEGATIAAESGRLVPSYLPVLYSDAFAQPGQWPRNVDVYGEGVRRAEPLPYDPTWPVVTAQTDAALQALFYDPVIDLEAALTEIDAQSVPLLDPTSLEDGEDPADDEG